MIVITCNPCLLAMNQCLQPPPLSVSHNCPTHTVICNNNVSDIGMSYRIDQCCQNEDCSQSTIPHFTTHPPIPHFTTHPPIPHFNVVIDSSKVYAGGEVFLFKMLATLIMMVNDDDE